jgi:hypothetical protein
VDLASQVEWISQTKGDGAGYDIHSFDDGGVEKFIEVKTTNGSERMAFYLTANELQCSERKNDCYWLYRVFLFSQTPGLYRLRGPLTSSLVLEPRVYVATCAVNAGK